MIQLYTTLYATRYINAHHKRLICLTSIIPQKIVSLEYRKQGDLTPCPKISLKRTAWNINTTISENLPRFSTGGVLVSHTAVAFRVI